MFDPHSVSAGTESGVGSPKGSMFERDFPSGAAHEARKLQSSAQREPFPCRASRGSAAAGTESRRSNERRTRARFCILDIGQALSGERFALCPGLAREVRPPKRLVMPGLISGTPVCYGSSGRRTGRHGKRRPASGWEARGRPFSPLEPRERPVLKH